MGDDTDVMLQSGGDKKKLQYLVSYESLKKNITVNAFLKFLFIIFAMFNYSIKNILSYNRQFMIHN